MIKTILAVVVHACFAWRDALAMQRGEGAADYALRVVNDGRNIALLCVVGAGVILWGLWYTEALW